MVKIRRYIRIDANKHNGVQIKNVQRQRNCDSVREAGLVHDGGVVVSRVTSAGGVSETAQRARRDHR